MVFAVLYGNPAYGKPTFSYNVINHIDQKDVFPLQWNYKKAGTGFRERGYYYEIGKQQGQKGIVSGFVSGNAAGAAGLWGR